MIVKTQGPPFLGTILYPNGQHVTGLIKESLEGECPKKLTLHADFGDDVTEYTVTVLELHRAFTVKVSEGNIFPEFENKWLMIIEEEDEPVYLFAGDEAIFEVFDFL